MPVGSTSVCSDIRTNAVAMMAEFSLDFRNNGKTVQQSDAAVRDCCVDIVFLPHPGQWIL